MFSARLKHLILVFFLFLASYFLFSTPVFAQSYQTQPLEQSNSYTNTNPDVPKNLHTWTQTVMIEVLSSATCMLAGIDVAGTNQKCLGFDQKTGKIGYVKSDGGAIGFMGNMIAVLYTPPIHTSDFTGYMARNFGIAKPAYADSCTDSRGIGYCGISPLIKIWSTFRNIVYLLFVIIFIFIGLAIMLRIKIDPRTVMTIENQIPKIIITLLLVTFSFAIAGFLIDLMYVLIYVIFNIFSTNLFIHTDQLTNAQRTFNGDNPLGFFNNLIRFLDITKDSSGGIKDIVQSLFTTTIPQEKSIVYPVISGIGDLISLDFVKNVLGGFIAWVAGAIAFLIILVAILWSMFRLWFQLLMAYIYILIDVVIAPFMIMTGVFPGGLGITAWLRDILANLSAFPVTITMFLFAKLFAEAFQDKSSGTLFVPPLIGNPGGSMSPIGSLIGLGVILMTPQVVTMMKDAFKAPQFKYTAAIGQAIGVGPGVVGGLAHNIVSPYGALANVEKFLGGAKAFTGQGKLGDRIKAASQAMHGVGLPKPQESGRG